MYFGTRIQLFVRAVVVTGSLVATGALFFPLSQPDAVALESVTVSSIVVEEPHTTEEWIPELPVRLVIPAIDVDAPVQQVGLDPDGSGAMGVPTNFTDVGWYTGGVRPGMKGAAVMAGHYNGKEIPEAVFYDLDQLEVGDQVVVRSAERIEDIFMVVRVETYPYDAPTDEVFLSDDGKARLNLITCGGEWLTEEDQYNERTVVFTEQLTDVE